MQNTNPYYRSSYALVQRADADTKVTSLATRARRSAHRRRGSDAADRRPGPQALLKNVQPYHLMVDTRYDSPGRDMVEDLAAGKIDVGVLWGPIAGYWAKQQSVPIEVVPLTARTPGRGWIFASPWGCAATSPSGKGS